MDNFMDKLAQRLTAQEMIKANSAADAAELERLQKQLAQYDACLQEMRKLSLKNMEATDKIGLLLDESINKIRALEANPAENDSITEVLQEQKTALGGMLQAQKDSLSRIVQEQVEALGELVQEQKVSIDGTLKAQQAEQKGALSDMEQSLKRDLTSDIRAELENSRAELNTLQEEIKATIEGMSSMDSVVEKINDFVHKENVKVYRNVQAVVVEENKKQTESLEAAQKKAAGKSGGILTVSIITLIAVLANIAWNVLLYLNIL